MMTRLRLAFALGSVFLAFPAAPGTAAPGDPVAPPDFTRGDPPGKAHDWTLGPTGARGWIHTANGHSREARQILVTAVADGSPASGRLAVGDVILGVGEAPFASDARIAFARAVADAETEEGGGRLAVRRWRSGMTETVTLSLPVLGRYGDTAPYGCAKSRRILEHGCASLARRMAAPDYERGLNPISRALNALALLGGGGEGDHLPLLQREARWAADFTTDGYLSWYYGYLMAYLGEYVMLTGDVSVQPGLERLALETARGQSGVGTWGHRFALPGGNLGGYGAMNAPGLSLTIGMVLAREAGVKHPDLDAAIAKSAAFLRWFVNKGAVPYGDHQPYFAHEDNGKCAAAAVLYDLLGDREAAEFFAKMSAAAYSERERGHTGNFFNMLWALSGVGRCGPTTTGAYLREHAWYYDLARDWDTKFVYQGSPVGEEESNAYKNWDCSGSYLLGYALPLKRLRLTGRGGGTVPPLDASGTADVIAAGRDFAYKGDANPYEARSTEVLLTGLASWSPYVRGRSAKALGKRPGDVVPELLALLAGPDRDARYGAIEALGALGPRADAAAPQLRAALLDPDPWIRCLAALALPELGPEARRGSVPDLLALIVRDHPADPRRQAARYAGFALFAPFPGSRGPRSILAESLDGVDRAQLIPALQTLLAHEDSIPRGAAGRTFPRLRDEDLVALLPQIVRAIENLAPSNEMFADGVRLAGLDLLSRLGIREGMALCVATIEPDRWGERNRSVACLTYLVRYGAHARALLPEVKRTRAYLADVKKVPADRLAELDRLVAAIESSTETPTLVNLAEFQAKPRPATK
jgi:HEAT repeat protein